MIGISPCRQYLGTWVSIFRSFTTIMRSSLPELFLGKGVLKMYRKFTGEQAYRSLISIKLQNN